MTLRALATTALLVLVAATVDVADLGAVPGQDRAWLRSWEDAQRHRPPDLTSRGRIAPADEPGTPMVIRGRVLQADGKTSAADAIVFAYQTDRDGHYDRPGSSPHSWRLRGWARTEADGRFELTTIRPGAYPSRTEPAHVHFTIETPAGERYWGQDLFPDRVAARRDGGVDHVDHVLRVEGRSKF